MNQRLSAFKRSRLLVLLSPALLTSSLAFAGPSTSEKSKNISWAKKEVVKLRAEVVNQTIRDAIASANRGNGSIGEKAAMKKIARIDRSWTSSMGVTDLMKPFLKNPCSDHLRLVKNKRRYISEIFVMDNLGAVVCESDKTSDYWQGDEAKWKEAFNKGKGGTHFSDPGFDESTQTFSMQVSFAVMEGAKAVGTVSIGIDLDEISEYEGLRDK